MATRRAIENPILTPAHVKASREDLEVVGVFNPAAIAHGDRIILMLRVAERPRSIAADEVAAPVYERDELVIKRWRRDTPGIDVSDSRAIVVAGETWLTSISHLRFAQSRDGVHFEVESRPAFAPGHPLEAFGVEDARLTLVAGEYVMNYTAVSAAGIATGIATSRDLTSWQRRGIAFAPNNRDVTIFPEQIGGRYAALHRPMPDGIGRPAIWYATSPDLLHWGDHAFVAGRRSAAWDDLKIGGGAVPFRVADGWLAIYHGVTREPMTYSLGALLLDDRDPSRVIARSREPILKPEAPYEVNGFFGNVVFTCGAVLVGDVVKIYYGAADGVTALADVPLDDILRGLA